jgi:integrase/recombinase XerD
VLSEDVDRYIALRRTLGYKLRKPARHLRAFALYAASHRETHVRPAMVLAWVMAAGRTQEARAERFRYLALFARFLHAEDPRHEVPARNPFAVRKTRPVPYIYTPDEIARVLDAAGKLRHQRPNPLRRELYIMMFGLIAATGLRVSEAIALRTDDVWPDGALHIRETKFCKSRLVPLHPTVVEALGRYLEKRRRIAADGDNLFPSVQHRALCPSTVNYTFRCLLRQAEIAPGRQHQPRIRGELGASLQLSFPLVSLPFLLGAGTAQLFQLGSNAGKALFRLSTISGDQLGSVGEAEPFIGRLLNDEAVDLSPGLQYGVLRFRQIDVISHSEVLPR